MISSNFVEGSPRSGSACRATRRRTASDRWRVFAGGAFLAIVAWASGDSQAQSPQPTPTPPSRIDQDKLDLLGRSSVVQGSGARAFGMGGAFLARADDASAASWNPAGLSYLRRPEVSVVMLGSNSLDSRSLFTTATGVTTDLDRRRGGDFDFVSATHPVSLRGFSGAVQVSFQRLLPFDARRSIERANGTVLIESEGGFDVLAFAAGVQVSRQVRLGLTINRWTHGFEQRLDRQTAVSSRQFLRFGIRGWNANLGAIWSPVENLNIGAVFKTPFTAALQLERQRQDVADLSEPTLGERPDYQFVYNSFSSDDGRLELPGAVGLGLSWRARSTLTLSVDYTRTFWSQGRIRNYFTLAACPPFNQCPPRSAPKQTNDFFGELRFPSLADQRQSDTEEIRLGVERVLLLTNAKLPLRAGFFSDRQYFQRPDGYAPRSAGFTLGAGLIVGPVLFDVAYVRESLGYATEDPAQPGRVQLDLERWYFSLIYRR